MAVGMSYGGFGWVCEINGGLMLQAYVLGDGTAIVREGEEKSFRKTLCIDAWERRELRCLVRWAQCVSPKR